MTRLLQPCLNPERAGVMEKSLIGKLQEFKESLPGRH